MDVVRIFGGRRGCALCGHASLGERSLWRATRAAGRGMAGTAAIPAVRAGPDSADTAELSDS